MDLHTVSAVVAPDVQWEPGDAWLAGGTWLFSQPQPDLRRLRDLAHTAWEPLAPTADGGLEIAATTTVARIAAYPHPLFGQCARAFLASSTIWQVATLGGNLCLGLPAGPMITLTAALDGVALLVATDGTRRTLPVLDLVTGPGRTALAPGELLRSVTLPGAALARRSACLQASLTTHGRSAALVVGTAGEDGALAVTVTASTPRPVRVEFDRAPSARELRAALDREPWYGDMHGDPAWRRHMTLLLAERIRVELAGAA